MKGKKMRGVLLCTLCLMVVIAITSAIDPVDEVDETEEEVARPIRASTSTSSSVTTRKRGRARHHRRRGSNNEDGSGTGKAVQKRRLQQGAFRPTRAPLFEASPADPFIDNGAGVQPTSQYGHSHSPPTADPYYSPSKFAREQRKRKRIKIAHDASLEPVTHNSFDQGSAGISTEFKEPEKNYAFAYAVGDEAEDFSHKQEKDGPITIGEYRITLPDGRTQVVRYTAGGKHGYKADVTYEAPNGHHQGHASGGHLQHQNQQYHASVKPTYHLASTPGPTLNSNRIYKSRPLKNTALHNNPDIEYSPASSSDDEEIEYHHPSPQPTPRIRIKTGGRIPQPSPTVADLLNGVSSTPTPRPNSIYDKISPYRNGDKYSGNHELAYAHENSPRAGPTRSKSKKIAKTAAPTQPTYYDSPHASPSPQPPRKVSHSPTKKYKDQGYYVSGAAAHHQPRAHQDDHFSRPLKHIQYLQETPIHHHHHELDQGILIAKPIKEPAHHVLALNSHYDKPESVAPQIAYTPQPIVARKPKKLKKIKHGIHTPVGQYLIQSPVHVTAQTPLHQQHHHHHVTAFPTHGNFHSHYYNSLHEPRHQNHGFGQLSASPTPITSVRHSESPLPNAYPVTAFPHTGSAEPFVYEQPRHRHPTPSSHPGHFYQESPPSGDRPNRLGIKEALSRLPVDDLPTPKTTIHPYEVGSADYGKSVAYGNGKGKGFQDSGYSPFPTGGLHSFDHLDPTNSLYSPVSSPSGPGFTGSGTGGTGQGFFPGDVSDQFNFLDGFHNYDIEQANVREIRQNRPTRSGSKGGRKNSNTQFSSRRLQRRPDKRRGAPAQSSEEKAVQPSTPRQRQKQTTSQPLSPPPRPQPTQPTTTRNRGRRRRVRTQQPDPMMQAVESRRARPTSASRSNNNSSRN